ncbi:hypothetical protein K438DRAFT_1807189 [Mycena galopus ATCC 62051]|nr:hypothetical protein K438DRAFT_1807189 [Mycena galopus ATCC 62051]
MEFAPPPTPEELARRALQANQAHQYALAQHAENLTADLAELDKLLSQADTEGVEDEIECDFYIPNAKPPVGPVRSFNNPESPFFQDVTKRNRYLDFTVRHAMPPKEVETLKTAVNAELRRVEQLDGALPNDAQITDKLNWTAIAEKVSDSSSIKRTAQECKIKWIGDLSTVTNRGPWKAAELQKLENIIKKQPSQTKVNWVEVSRELGTNRLPLDCMRQMTDRPRFNWNAESDQKLLDAVRQYGFAWSLVAKYVSPNLIANQCSTRYLRTLDSSLARGSWTAEEDERLKAAVAGYGRTAWAEVAGTIPGRTNEQCRERWLGSFDPTKTDKKGNGWDEEKDAALIEAVKVNGRKWKVIAVQLDRPANACRLRYDSLDSPVAGPSTLPETPLAEDETETPSAPTRSTPRKPTKKVQPKAIVTPSVAGPPPRPRPRRLVRDKVVAPDPDSEEEEEEEEEEETPTKSNTRGKRNATANQEKDSEEEAPKKNNTRGKRKAATDPEKDSEEEAPKKNNTRGRRRAVAHPPEDSEEVNPKKNNTRGKRSAAADPEGAPPSKKRVVQVTAEPEPQKETHDINSQPAEGTSSLSSTDLASQPAAVVETSTTQTSPKKGRRRVSDIKSVPSRRSARLAGT